MAYFDAASDRLGEAASLRFAEMVEAVRMGTGFLRDAKAYSRWRTDVNRRHRPASTKRLADLLRDHGGNVERGVPEFRPN